MTAQTADELRARLAERLSQQWGFPVSSAPYCDLAEELGSTELDVLNVVLELRETGAIGPITAELAEGPLGFCSIFDGEEMTLPPVAGVELTCDEAELALLLEDGIPYSERPYEELAAELQMRAIEADEAWVLDRLRTWIDVGVLVRFGAET